MRMMSRPASATCCSMGIFSEAGPIVATTFVPAAELTARNDGNRGRGAMAARPRNDRAMAEDRVMANDSQNVCHKTNHTTENEHPTNNIMFFKVCLEIPSFVLVLPVCLCVKVVTSPSIHILIYCIQCRIGNSISIPSCLVTKNGEHFQKSLHLELLI